MPLNRSPAVLAFAGSDPTGGAGLQADLLTLSNLGCYALTVVTAITAQDTEGVAASQAVDTKLVVKQASIALADIHVSAFKIGMVGSADNAIAIAKIVAKHKGRPVVVDPVLASGRGDPLAGKGVIAAIKESLLGVATLITPNSLEARKLAGLKEHAPLADAARALIDLGVPHVLITGTHEDHPEVVNTLYGIEGVIREDAWERLPGSYHGSGCTLAAAIAATLANGLELAEAVRAAQEYTWQTLAHAQRLGKGQALPDRFFWVRHETAETTVFVAAQTQVPVAAQTPVPVTDTEPAEPPEAAAPESTA
jgi:hydroxymethylpyrimidine/phosphomethylpyrimidine kinase